MEHEPSPLALAAFLLLAAGLAAVLALPRGGGLGAPVGPSDDELIAEALRGPIVQCVAADTASGCAPTRP